MAAFNGELLRTLVAIIDSGGFAKAGVRRHLTQSTVSQQMKRLEGQVGRPLFAASGRRRVLTEAGEIFAGYARKILALEDAAELALRDGQAGGSVRVGCTQDFAESRLPGALRAFGRSHPRVRLEVRVGPSRELHAAVDDALLDVAIVFDDDKGRAGVGLRRERAAWLAASSFSPPVPGEPWPLALFDPPCVFRDAALAALDARQIPWRIAYSSPSLTGLRAAVEAGLAVTPRLARQAGGRVRTLAGLPPLGSFRVALVVSPEPPSAATGALVAAFQASARHW